MKQRVFKLGVLVTVIAITAGFVFTVPSFSAPPVQGCIDNGEIISLPCTIETSGYYFLTNNLTSQGTGIDIGGAFQVKNVTIDLRGYTIFGDGTGDGIYVGSADEDVEIRNGTVTNFYRGVVGSGSTNVRVINIRAINNNLHGILLQLSEKSLVKDSTASGNGAMGIWLGKGSTATGNIVGDNANTGINAFFGDTVIGNSVYNNGGHGISAENSTIKNNTTYSNNMNGINLINNCLVDGNTSVDNSSGINISQCSTCTFGTNHAP
jgi:parallel beta-helix repeat protein